MSRERLSKESANYMELVQSRISSWQFQRLMEIVEQRNIPISQLVACAVDREFEKPVDERFDFGDKIPETEFIEDAYLTEAQKIVDYMKLYDKGVHLRILLLNRHVIGVPCRVTFMYAFRELIRNEIIESFRPKVPKKIGFHKSFQYNEDYRIWTVRGPGRGAGLTAFQKEKRRKQYEKLKKEFGNE